MIRDILFGHGGLFMRYAIILILAMAAGAVQAEPNDPNIAAAVAEVQAKVAELDAKVYTGTFTFRELMAARVADINEVVRDVKFHILVLT